MDRLDLPQLDGVYAKLDRADVHGQRLKNEVADFIDSRPFRLISEPDATIGTCRLRAEIDRPIPAIAWGVQLGEIVHALRSSLDHLAWQLALTYRPGETPSRRTEFPIFTDSAAFDRAAPRKLACIHPRARDAIRALQPFSVYARPDRHPLWYLHELNNVDKHRVLNVVAAILRSVSFFEEAVEDLGIDPAAFAYVHTFADGDVLATWPLTPTCSQTAERLHFGFGIAFDPAGPARGWPVDNAIEHWSPFIRTTIIPALAPFLVAQ